MVLNLKKILLVDDDRFILQLLSKALEKEGFFCLKAQSAQIALQILEKEIPEIILSDYEMPEMNGFEFREQLLLNDKLKNIPFVFLTSVVGQEMVLKGLNLQAVDYIVKETPIPVVVSKINNLLHTVRERHEQSLQELRKTAEALNLRSVPFQAPKIEGFYIDFWHQSYQNYPGGDFIDFIQIDNQYTFIVLGDVMGKKWGAWFFSFNFLSYIRSAVRLCVFDGDLSTASILQKINRVIYMDPVLSDVLSTLALVLIDHTLGKVVYSGAGDLPMVYFNSKTGAVNQIDTSGLLLGVFSDGQYNEQQLELASGDKLLLISDGMIDFEDADGKKSDYPLFINKIKPFFLKNNTLELVKSETFFQESSKEQIDDCSVIYIEKQ